MFLEMKARSGVLGGLAQHRRCLGNAELHVYRVVSQSPCPAEWEMLHRVAFVLQNPFYWLCRGRD